MSVSSLHRADPLAVEIPLRADLLLTWDRKILAWSPMRVTVNGDPRELPDGSTISALLQQLGLEGPVAVERNANVVPRALHPTVQLEEQDVIEIVHFVGGG
jgi:sulfur carrier protein